MWCCFILPFSTFYTQSTCMLVVVVVFPTIFRLFACKTVCLFSLNPKFKCSHKQFYIMNSQIFLFCILQCTHTKCGLRWNSSRFSMLLSPSSKKEISSKNIADCVLLSQSGQTCIFPGCVICLSSTISFLLCTHTHTHSDTLSRYYICF